MGNNISSLRTLEASVLARNNGRLSADGAAQLAAEVKKNGSNPDDLAALKEMFAHDAFDKGVNPNKVLSDAKLPGKVTHDDVAGSNVGTTSVNGRDMQVMAKRTFGPPEGFSNKFQAISEARLAGVEPMAIVQDKAGKYHAVQTNVELQKPLAGTTPLKKFDPEALKKVMSDSKLTEEQRYQKAAAIELGVPESQINVVRDPKDFKDDVININLGVGGKVGGGRTTHVHGAGCGCGATLEIAKDLVEGPMNRLRNPDPDKAKAEAAVQTAVDSLATTVFHEGTHVADGKLVAAAAKKFGKPLPDPTDSSRAANVTVKGFTDWLIKTKDFTPAEKAQIMKFQFGQRGTEGEVNVEAHAYVSAFVAAFEKNPEIAQGQLKRAGAGAGTLDPRVRGELVDQLKQRYRTLPEDQKTKFYNAVLAADANNKLNLAPELLK